MERSPRWPHTRVCNNENMKIGADGLLYQGQFKHSPAWKSVEVRAKQPKQPKQPRSQTDRMREAGALEALYSNGIPQAGPPDCVTNGDLHAEVNNWLAANKKKLVSKDTVLRASGRRLD